MGRKCGFFAGRLFRGFGGLGRPVRLCAWPNRADGEARRIEPDQGGLVLDSAVPDARVVVSKAASRTRTIYSQFDSLEA